MTVTSEPVKPSSRVIDWLLRLVKGALVGIGAIVPGLSGGALAVVFQLYEPIMRFLGNLRHNFIKNVLFFIPVGIGGILGVVGFSAVVDWAFTFYAAQFTWLFVGLIAGTYPSLIKAAGKEGRKPFHWVILVAAAAAVFWFMNYMETMTNVTMAPSIGAWVLCGVLFGLGVVVPGMSPSNFIIYLGLYQPMASGIRQLDFSVIIPLFLGVAVVVLAFARLISWLFKVAYPVVFHIILGIVIGSTLAIAPWNISGWTIAVCALLFLVGGAISFALAKLDEKYPHESIF